MEDLKDIVVIYHAHCYDGFGAAYAAWKKFGDTASYYPTIERNAFPEGIRGKEVYVVDFCFNAQITTELVSANKSLVILDHHIGSKEVTLSVPDAVYSDTDSGAKIAWKYFHPGTEVPKLIDYLSDSDTWNHSLPHWREVEGYIHIHELAFGAFEALHKELEHGLEDAIEKGKVLNKQFDNLVQEHVEKAMLVECEGYVVYAVNASSFLRSDLGHVLAMKKGPFAIVYRFEQDVLRVSFRGDGSIDCTKIAEKYGGSGHHNAAAIILRGVNPLPFKKV
jgi:oligoribonuclease NrnB/cAMP/cGMP phosphodiesterase (DHH superfamily)